MINGICIISFFTNNTLQFEDMKSINDGILKTIEDKKDEQQ